MDKYLIFQINKQDYVLNVENIKEIIEYREPSPVPKAESHILGMIKIRSDVITLMDSKVILNTESDHPIEKSTILILENGSKKIGFVVDSVSSVITVKPSEIMQSPLLDFSSNKKSADYVTGVINRDDKLLIVIDLTKTILFLSE